MCFLVFSYSRDGRCARTSNIHRRMAGCSSHKPAVKELVLLREIAQVFPMISAAHCILAALAEFRLPDIVPVGDMMLCTCDENL